MDLFFTSTNKNQQVQETDGTADTTDDDVCIGEQVWHGIGSQQPENEGPKTAFRPYNFNRLLIMG